MIQLFLLLTVTVFLLLLVATVLAHIFFLVPYVPSKQKVVQKMVNLARLRQNDVVYDLGCGDGRLLLEAEKVRKIRGVGFEIAPLVYLLALIKKMRHSATFSLKFKNFFHINLSRANVIFCYLLPGAMQTLSEKIQKECRKGTRIVSQTFRLPGFEPIKIIKKNRRTNMPTIYLYQV